MIAALAAKYFKRIKTLRSFCFLSFFLSFCPFVEYGNPAIRFAINNLSLSCLLFRGMNACLSDFVMVFRQWAGRRGGGETGGETGVIL